MKTFRFRLERALEWRTAQADLERAKCTRTAARVSELQADLESRRDRMISDAKEVSGGGTGASVAAWAAYSRRAQREIAEMEKRLREAERLLGEQLRACVEAGRKVKLLENLKRDGRARWTAELARETEAFAGEAFLEALNRRRLQSEQKTGA